MDFPVHASHEAWPGWLQRAGNQECKPHDCADTEYDSRGGRWCGGFQGRQRSQGLVIPPN
jgi:hypothetical protein